MKKQHLFGKQLHVIIRIVIIWRLFMTMGGKCHESCVYNKKQKVNEIEWVVVQGVCRWRAGLRLQE